MGGGSENYAKFGNSGGGAIIWYSRVCRIFTFLFPFSTEAPQFTEKPENITVTVGESGQTTCAGTGIPVPKITWARMVSKSVLPKNFKVVKKKTMIVEKADLTNAGTYFCMLANGPTSISAEFEVIVNGECELYTHFTLAS